MTPTILAFGMPGGWELGVCAVVALLFFGKRLPEVARSVGKSIVEFKKGLREVKSEVTAQTSIHEPAKLEQHAAPASPAAPDAPATPQQPGEASPNGS